MGQTRNRGQGGTRTTYYSFSWIGLLCCPNEVVFPAVNPNLMRAIDYWVGIPLVFLLTVVYRLQRLIGLATSPAGRPRNILFIQLAEMGTMVVAYPSLTKARELYPDATLHFLCFTQIRPSVEILDIIPSENIITIDAHSGPALVRDTLAVSVACPASAHRHRDQHGSVRAGTAAC